MVKTQNNDKKLTNLNRFSLLLMLICVVALYNTGCDNSFVNPQPPEENEPSPTARTAFAPVKITFSGIGTGQMKAEAHFPKSPTNISDNNMAASLTEISSIQMRSHTHGSFTYGTRGAGGMRYIYATFQVRNAQADGTPYSTPLENLAFIAVDTDQTYGVSVISELRRFNGDLLTGSTAEAIALATIPTGKVGVNLGNITPMQADVLQVYTEMESDAFQSTLPASTSINDVFPFGFTTFPRTLDPNPSVTEYRSSVTFAFKLPLQATPDDDPFEITAVFLPVSDSDKRVTQSLEEQTQKGLNDFTYRLSFASYNNLDGVNLLPGSLFYGDYPVRFFCAPVRVAGTTASPVNLFSTPPVFQGFIPDPYNGGANNILSGSIQFGAQFDIPVPKPPTSRTFTVHGSQSGRHFIGMNYTTNGTGTISSPSGSFFPGEIVEVTATRGLGSCEGFVTRYRASTALQNVTFNGNSPFLPPGNNPKSIVAGDFNGDGDLDLATANNGSNTVSILLNNNGNFFPGSVKTVPVAATPQNISSLTAVDFNNDGLLDLAVPLPGNTRIAILFNQGSGNFSPLHSIDYGLYPGGSVMEEVISGDFNGDGSPDLITYFSGTTSSAYILFNDGKGGIGKQSDSNFGDADELTSGDFDNDGDMDLAAMDTDSDQISVYHNNGLGNFNVIEAVFLTGSKPADISAGDFNSDGYIDLITANETSQDISVVLNDGDGTFTNPVGEGNYAPVQPFSRMVTGDMDGDKDLDVVLVGGTGSTNVMLMENTGNAVFSQTQSAFGFAYAPVLRSTIGDFNNDAILDVAMVGDGGDILIVE